VFKADKYNLPIGNVTDNCPKTYQTPCPNEIAYKVLKQDNTKSRFGHDYAMINNFKVIKIYS
jgi:hypothetical protein